MAEEIQEAVQIIRVAYDGIEIAMKVGSGGLAAMQKAVDFFKGMLDYEKSMGKTSMRKLLLRGGDLQVFQFNTEDRKKFEKLAKKYGILYSALPDVNSKDGKSEILFHSEAVPRVNILMQKLGFGRIANFDDYLKNGNEQQLGKLMDFLQGQKKGNAAAHTEGEARANVLMDGLIEKVGMYAMEKQNISVDAVKTDFALEKEQAETVVSQLTTIGVLNREADGESFKVAMDKDTFLKRIRGYQELADRIRTVAACKNPELADVTISKTLIVQESDHAVKTRVPGTWGEDVRYLWINKSNIMEIHNGKTMLTFLDKSKEYKLYDDQNRVVATMKGDALYAGHYDRVDAAVRERYEHRKIPATESVRKPIQPSEKKR